jgi:hypothetical protein
VNVPDDKTPAVWTEAMTEILRRLDAIGEDMHQLVRGIQFLGDVLSEMVGPPR